MKRLRVMVLAAACVSQTGCYHQVFNTGLAKAWHPSFVFGLVAGAPIDVRTVCPSGVAIASTRMTFANGLVGGLTLGIFTPHEVKVVCASRAAALPGSDIRTLASGASREEADRVLAAAIETAGRTNQDVMIVIERSAVHTMSLEPVR
jgi:TRAP-type C4-dicarboxylate transport system permease large subunit